MIKTNAFRWQKTVLAAAAAGLLALPAFAADDKAAEAAAYRSFGNKHSDNASARSRWQAEWYNEAQVGMGNSASTGPSKTGAPFSVEYRKFLMNAAAKERANNLQKMPKTGTANFAGTADFAAATGTNWINIGPTKADVIKNGGSSLTKTDAGRVRNIVVDPTNTNVIYGAFAGGGVWKSTDGGTNWVSKTDSLGSLSVGALTMDPNNSNTLYLGLGDPFDGTGIGLVKSTDGGNTWSAPVFLGNSTTVTSLMVSPSSSSVVLATTNLGVYRSADAGATWAPIALATGQTATPYGWSLAWTGGSSFVVSVEANPVATTGTTDGQIHYSSNNGATWSKASGVTVTGGVGRMTVASAPSARTTLYAMAAVPLASTASDLAEIFKSTNGGQTWTATGAGGKRYTNRNTESSTLKTLLNGQGWYDHAVVVDTTNANTAYFGGALLLAKTTDGGVKYAQKTNWLAQYSLPYVHADFHTATMVGSTLYVGSDGGIFKSTDGGTTFSDSLNVGLATHLIYSVGSSPNKPDAVIGGFQDNGTRVRSGATNTYNQYLGGDGFGSDINASNGNMMLGSLYYTRIYKSTNGGSTFVAANTGITESNNSSTAPFNTGIVSWAGDATGNTVYTWANAKAYKSTNYATSWTAMGVTGIPTTPALYIRGLGVDRSNSNRVGLVANSGRLFLSSNGGTSWTQSGALPNHGSSLSSVAFDPTNANVVYVSSVAADATKSHVWKSNDGGLSFAAIDGNGFPAGVPVNTLKLDPGASSTIYAGTHLGVYRSTDAGATWSRFGNGMPLVNVTDVYVSSDSSMVRAATFGRGFWQLNP